MRKTLLFAAALCLAATTATAQTFADPLTPTEGNNSYQATSPSTIYWKFTADADYIATFGQYGDSEVPMVAIESNGRPSYITGVTASLGYKNLCFRKRQDLLLHHQCSSKRRSGLQPQIRQDREPRRRTYRRKTSGNQGWHHTVTG